MMEEWLAMASSPSEISSAQVPLTDGQVLILGALIKYINRPRNPLRILKDEIYPRLDSPKVGRSPYRSTRNDLDGLAPQYAAEWRRGLLIEWANRCNLFTRG